MKNAEFAKCLPKKTELVVWAHLSHVQRELYESYLVDGGQVSAVLSGETRSPLQAITYLKKLCDHPSLVTDEHARRGSELNKSAKLDILLQLMKSLRKDGHRCLIFSPSTKILDIIEVSLSQTIKLARIDGSTKGKDRQSIVDNFNREGSVIDAMLLSTKAAGIGLNLTSADSAIIFSPSWNPADDSQAVDRCYRIGQRKDVVVYRFITAGTVEGEYFLFLPYIIDSFIIHVNAITESF
jgi:SNF2 family DNA or RNA helicase